MKKLLIVLVVILLIGIALAILTKPSDQACIDQIKDKLTAQIEKSDQNAILKVGEELLVDKLSHYTQYMFRIENNILYKNIYIKGTDTKIGVGFFGMVALTNDASNQVKQDIEGSITQDPNNITNMVGEVKKDIKNLFQKKKSKEAPNEQNNMIQELNGNHGLAYWQNQLWMANANVDADKTKLNKEEKFHLGRLHSTRKQEINNASMKLEQDYIRVQQCSDSVKKYQE